MPDDRFIDEKSGVNANVSSSSQYYPDFSELTTLRYFPDSRAKYCYSFPVTPNTTYRIRGTFFYGNYDNQNTVPKFQMAIEGTIVASNFISEVNVIAYQEISFVPQRNVTFLCLSRDITNSVPFISAISLVKSNPEAVFAHNLYMGYYYVTQFRWNFGGNGIIRYVISQNYVRVPWKSMDVVVMLFYFTNLWVVPSPQLIKSARIFFGIPWRGKTGNLSRIKVELTKHGESSPRDQHKPFCPWIQRDYKESPHNSLIMKLILLAWPCFLLLLFICRSPDDIADHYWFPVKSDSSYVQSTAQVEALTATNIVNATFPPKTVMDTALTTNGTCMTIDIPFPQSYIWFMILYWSELNPNASASSRQFYVGVPGYETQFVNPLVNTSGLGEIFHLVYSGPVPNYVRLFKNLSISTALGPLVNALEIFELSQNQFVTLTNEQDSKWSTQS